ncbi:mechanosensitive ion channel family protein [Pseudorhodoferax sp.]|uniref:mechanosensitive ion channel family protein n=1 Tax=Pseudorhodoferax sp. TaxID=1993553 RepID=UPI0039E27AFF
MDQINVMLEPVRAFLFQVGAFLPRLAIAALVLLAGFLIAKAARFTVEKGLRAINFHVLTRRAGLDGFLQQGGTQADTIGLLGLLSYWVVILAALIVAFSGLGLTHVTELLSRVMLFVPQLIVALLVLAFGAYFARFVSNAVATYCKGVGIHDTALARIAYYAVLAFVVMIALDQMGIGGTLVRDAFLLILGGVVLAVALAFGLGGKDWAAAQLERWWPSKPDDRRDPPDGLR